ncbi:unnamed protein product [Phaeothamnion confervicola]
MGGFHSDSCHISRLPKSADNGRRKTRQRQTIIMGCGGTKQAFGPAASSPERETGMLSYCNEGKEGSQTDLSLHANDSARFDVFESPNAKEADDGGASSNGGVAEAPLQIALDVSLDTLGELTYVGRGMFCAVFSCEYRGASAVVKIGRSDVVAEVVERDLNLERDCLSKLNHPSICRILGAGVEPSPFLLLERLSDTLSNLVGSEQGHDPSLAGTLRRRKLRKKLPWDAVYRVGAELAEGLCYLHERAIPGGGFIVHRDLKPTNVGLSADGHVRIYDFGLARVVPERQTLHQKFKMTGETGSMRYMAPEVAIGKPYDHTVDVYSFALILWEMAALRRPYSGLGEADFHALVVNQNFRPPLEKSWNAEFRAILEGCWHADPDQRMSAGAAGRALRALAASSSPRSLDGGSSQFNSGNASVCTGGSARSAGTPWPLASAGMPR